MPALHLETSLRSKRLLGHILGVHGPPTPRGRQIADGYVRLVEKAILEYQAARERWLAYHRDGYADDDYRAQDHIETACSCMHRAIEYLERLRGMGFRGADGSPFVPRPRDLDVLREDVRRNVREFRDAAEHFDRDIIAGKIPPKQEVRIHLGWEKASLGGAELRYSDVAEWLRQLHYFAGLLSRVIIKVGQPPSVQGEEP